MNALPLVLLKKLNFPSMREQSVLCEFIGMIFTEMALVVFRPEWRLVIPSVRGFLALHAWALLLFFPFVHTEETLNNGCRAFVVE